MNKTIKIILLVVLLAILALIPTVFGVYYSSVFLTFAIFSLYAVAFNVLLGFTGLLSFGHAMFFGSGAYGTALALKHIEGISLCPAILLGILAAFAMSAIICPMVVRLSGHAFAMVHLALGQLVYVLALKLRTITGGEDGIANFPIPDLNLFGLISIPLDGEPQNIYYLCMFIVVVGIWLLWYLTKTPFGQVQVGIRDNHKRIAYLGYTVPQARALIYLISGTFSGLAGVAYTLYSNCVSADGSFGIMTSFGPIMQAVIGGIGNFVGPILGTAVLNMIEEILTLITDQIEVATGVILIVVIMYAPQGITGFYAMLKEKWQGSSVGSIEMEKTT